MIYDLPTSVEIAGEQFKIRSDYRCILDIICALNDPELTKQDKIYISLAIFYEEMPPVESMETAIKECFKFIDGGSESEKSGAKKPKVMDWEQDFQYICAAINQKINSEIRSISYLHWWTFLGYYMDIGDCTFSQIVSIRRKRLKGKKLEKYEEEFYRENADMINLKNRYTPDEDDFINSLLHKEVKDDG